MKKGLAIALSIIGIILLVVGVLGAFGIIQLGTFKWAGLILGIIFFPAGIKLMRSTSE